MPPQTVTAITEIKHSEDGNGSTKNEPKDNLYKSFIGTYETELKWFNIISISIVHMMALWGGITFPYFQAKKLFFFGLVVGHLSGLGVTGGAHRLWTHRSYKAKLPLRIFLMFCYTLAAQNTLFEWVRDHRVHHKYTETDADPHNSKRGFFFSHVGWLMMKKHPEVLRRGKEIDMSDILADPVVQFHLRHFTTLKLLFAFILPTAIPPMLWNESWFWSFIGICFIRYTLSLNFTWSVNSFAHIFGNKPYDKNIMPAENLGVAIVALGEGWHNYHHTFPWDYKTAELWKYNVNLTALWIDIFAKIGWAYDLKTASKQLIQAVALRRGDGCHEHIEINENGEDVDDK
ncbi:hypothetical protein FQA39_LY04864 [Lamprigera yunnana]|nr:hypothetical protein FQA39_LY04864 [Lamprigera yunnana]